MRSDKYIRVCIDKVFNKFTDDYRLCTSGKVNESLHCVNTLKSGGSIHGDGETSVVIDILHYIRDLGVGDYRDILFKIVYGFFGRVLKENYGR